MTRFDPHRWARLPGAAALLSLMAATTLTGCLAFHAGRLPDAPVDGSTVAIDGTLVHYNVYFVRIA